MPAGSTIFNWAGRKGLADVVVSPVLHGLDGRLDRGVTGDDDDFGRHAGGLDLLENLQAAGARHHEIDQHDVKIAGERRPEAGFGCLEILHLMPFELQRPLATQADHRFIVDNENSQPRLGGFCILGGFIHLFFKGVKGSPLPLGEG